MVNEKDPYLELPSQSLLQGESDEPVLFWQCCVGKLKQTQQAVLESAAGTQMEYIQSAEKRYGNAKCHCRSWPNFHGRLDSMDSELVITIGVATQL